MRLFGNFTIKFETPGWSKDPELGLIDSILEQHPFSSPPPCRAVINLGAWKDCSETMIDDYNALLVKSKIPCIISGEDLEIIHSGQKAELSEVNNMNRTFFLIIFLLICITQSFCQSLLCDSLIDIIRLDDNNKAKEIISNKKFNVNCLSEYGTSPLGAASIRGNIQLVKFLLKKGADPNLKQTGKYKSGQTPIFDAVFIYPEVLEPNTSDNKVYKKDDYAIKDNIAKLLIKNGANIHIVDNDNTTLLMSAAIHERKFLVEMFIKNGVNVNAQNLYGNTALIYAVSKNNVDITRLILSGKADTEIKNNDGLRAIDIADENNFSNIVNLLQSFKSSDYN